ncbi:MAG: transposase [Cyanobacteria bacterium]|nr:transposase [Cyanobacteria bacterium CG_2015-16_32_12]NCO78067.1 transposase [Cyanobacteria bacterium CG_2015-22_32_23]NCQ04811.1 transposase [Cyanobacteria bacterium CG_2015-09_32_10]NCQ41679.1 transposase [Cyanobacteria bacterium CG_2015-04_32_10]NCS83820.1 transposase [Cyanobacteria bacterium CG_2015-02_32_10]
MNFSDSLLKITRRKLPHWELDGSIYFITFNTYQRLQLNPSARKIVLNCCLFFDDSRHQNDKRYHTFAIVIMPDHVHWLMQPLSKSNGEYWSLSSILHSVKSYSSKQIPKVMNHSGIVWHEERYDRIIRNEEEFLNTWQYIRENPVKANLATTPEEYPCFWQENCTG